MPRPSIVDLAKQRVVVFDGAMGTGIHAHNLPLSDFNDCENCSEVLVLTRPDIVVDIHESFLAVGCDAVMTNTFGASKLLLGEFDLQDRTQEINRRAAEIARQACSSFERPTRPRFVIGSMGPGTRLPSLGQVTWDVLHDSYMEQAQGLLDGGVDAILIETCQDILQAKCAIVAATDAMSARDRAIPVFCTVTIETTGTMLVGTDIAAAWTALEPYAQVVGIGLNCATGPQEMSEHLRFLSRAADRLVIVQPNAGLPQIVNGQPNYPLPPAELARWLSEFVETDGVNIVGGCCGTTPAHLSAVVDAVGEKRVTPRTVHWEPSVASLYQSVPLKQENAYLAVGERTNANGSKRFRELLASDDVDGMVQVAREQVKNGSHLLDICTAYVGRDEVADMTTLVGRLVTDVTAPLVLDSTEVPVLDAALKLVGGKCIINSINLEDGEEKLHAICRLAKRYSAALVALTIDEEGMAKTAERKVAIAERIYSLVTETHGIDPGDLMFDPLTFTICTGNEEDRTLGLETIDALSRIKRTCPGAQTLLGISNISFGVKPPVRRVLNSVFLHRAREAGLDAAIAHTTGIVPLFKIDDHHRKMAEDLVFNRRGDGHDPLIALLDALTDVQAPHPTEQEAPKSVDQRLKRRIIDGNRTGLEEDLDEAMLTSPPLTIVNDFLLDGMKTVGDLFGAGQMQLPFVLQSAETMKAAVRYLEPLMEKADIGSKGTIILATVKGDVHDIGKNLVDIILTNNGYTVHNLGIKQPIGNIVEAFEQHDADAIGMSGLLVKSTVVMRENLAVLNERGVTPPILLGGAALTRKYVDQDLRPVYHGDLYYAKDAFAGLNRMNAIAEARSERVTDGVSARPQARPIHATAPAAPRARAEAMTPTSPPHPLIDADQSAERRFGYVPPQSDISRTEPVPKPPFWGARVVDYIEPKAALAYLNENMLFHVQWQYRKGRLSREAFRAYIDTEVRPILRDMLKTCADDDILLLRAVYGFWPVQSDGDQLIVYDPQDRENKIARFDFPRQGKPPYWCLSDFFRPVGGGVFDVAAFSVVTAGRKVSQVAQSWFEQDRYKDYLHLHGLGVEIAESLAEYIHKQIRIEWGIAGGDARDRQEIFKQRYQGSRYSFGYPACPRLEDQLKLWPILKPGRIGVTLTDEFQLEPEQTTTALICHHKQAKYFNVR